MNTLRASLELIRAESFKALRAVEKVSPDQQSRLRGHITDIAHHAVEALTYFQQAENNFEKPDRATGDEATRAQTGTPVSAAPGPDSRGARNGTAGMGPAGIAFTGSSPAKADEAVPPTHPGNDCAAIAGRPVNANPYPRGRW